MFQAEHHASLVLQQLKNQWTRSLYCDVIIYFNGEYFLAHSCVLAACSPYFDTLLKGKLTPQLVNLELPSTGVSSDTFRKVLSFLYSGTLFINDEDEAANLIQASNLLQIRQLILFCSQFFMQNVSKELCLSILYISKRYNLDDLSKVLQEYVDKHAEQILLTLETCTLPLHSLKHMIFTQVLQRKMWHLSDALFVGIVKWLLYWMYSLSNINAFSSDVFNSSCSLLNFIPWQHISPRLIRNLLDIIVTALGRSHGFVEVLIKASSMHTYELPDFQHGNKNDGERSCSYKAVRAHGIAQFGKFCDCRLEYFACDQFECACNFDSVALNNPKKMYLHDAELLLELAESVTNCYSNISVNCQYLKCNSYSKNEAKKMDVEEASNGNLVSSKSLSALGSHLSSIYDSHLSKRLRVFTCKERDRSINLHTCSDKTSTSLLDQLSKEKIAYCPQYPENSFYFNDGAEAKCQYLPHYVNSRKINSRKTARKLFIKYVLSKFHVDRSHLLLSMNLPCEILNYYFGYFGKKRVIDCFNYFYSGIRQVCNFLCKNVVWKENTIHILEKVHLTDDSCFFSKKALELKNVHMKEICSCFFCFISQCFTYCQADNMSFLRLASSSQVTGKSDNLCLKRNCFSNKVCCSKTLPNQRDGFRFSALLENATSEQSCLTRIQGCDLSSRRIISEVVVSDPSKNDTVCHKIRKAQLFAIKSMARAEHLQASLLTNSTSSSEVEPTDRTTQVASIFTSSKSADEVFINTTGEFLDVKDLINNNSVDSNPKASNSLENERYINCLKPTKVKEKISNRQAPNLNRKDNLSTPSQLVPSNILDFHSNYSKTFLPVTEKAVNKKNVCSVICTNEMKKRVSETKSSTCIVKRKRSRILLRQERRICDLCETDFVGREYFRHMQEKHFPGPSHKCDTCEREFARIYGLLEHRLTHSTVKPHVCSVCSFSTSKLSNLRVHQLTHSLVLKPFKCQSCDHSFARKQQLTEHMNSHSADRLFSCSLCSYSAKTRHQLMLHTRTHSGKVFACPEENCHYTTSKKSHLTDHVLTHTGARPFICETCKKSYRTKRHLTRHQTSHQPTRLHGCDLCDYSASRSDTLKLHKKNVHSSNRAISKRAKCSRRSKAALRSHLEQPCPVLAAASTGGVHDDTTEIFSEQSCTRLPSISVLAKCGTDYVFRSQGIFRTYVQTIQNGTRIECSQAELFSEMEGSTTNASLLPQVSRSPLQESFSEFTNLANTTGDYFEEPGVIEAQTSNFSEVTETVFVDTTSDAFTQSSAPVAFFRSRSEGVTRETSVSDSTTVYIEYSNDSKLPEYPDPSDAPQYFRPPEHQPHATELLSVCTSSDQFAHDDETSRSGQETFHEPIAHEAWSTFTVPQAWSANPCVARNVSTDDPGVYLSDRVSLVDHDNSNSRDCPHFYLMSNMSDDYRAVTDQHSDVAVYEGQAENSLREQNSRPEMFLISASGLPFHNS